MSERVPSTISAALDYRCTAHFAELVPKNSKTVSVVLITSDHQEICDCISIISSRGSSFKRPSGRGPTAILVISREKLVAIVSQIPFVLVFVEYRRILARYVAKWGIEKMCLCKTKF